MMMISHSDIDLIEEVMNEKQAQLREAQDSALGFSVHAARLKAQADALARAIRHLAVELAETA